MKAKRFNQGFATIEYTASALIDQALHTAALASSSQADDFNSESKTSTPEDKASPQPMILTDVNEFEKVVLTELGIPEGLALRHRPAHFLRKYYIALCLKSSFKKIFF